MQFQAFFAQFLEAFLESALTYALFAFPFFLVFWIIWKKKMQSIRIQEVERASVHHFKHDLLHSTSTFMVFAILDVVLVYLQSKGYTKLYYDVNQYGWIWMVVSLGLLLILNDAFFYWSHRAMHHPRLYKFFHRVHHESTDPSPLTAFAFHPSEAVVEAGMAFILPFVMPLHLGVILTWQVLDMLNNVLGHLGYEVYPKGWTKAPILRHITTSTHHNMHHQQFNGNYALYFTWWDKWMGTQFNDYEARHEQIFERKNNPSTPLIQTNPNEAQTTHKAIITISMHHQVYQFETNSQQTILQSGLAQNVPMPFSCQKGLCGTCKMKCIEGQVTMKNNQALGELELKAGYILTCQSLPLTDAVVLQKE